MAKLHTRQDRKTRMHTNRDRCRSKRPKTFKTEEAAKKYAETNKIENYTLVNLKSTDSKQKKIRIEVS